MFLSTAVIIVQGKSQAYNARALLDARSQSHFMTQDLAQKLGIKRNAAYIPINHQT